MIKNHGATAVHLYQEVIEVQFASHGKRPFRRKRMKASEKKHDSLHPRPIKHCNNVFLSCFWNSLDCYLPTHYFVSVLPVWHDVIELINESPQISHLVGFLSVESKGLGVFPNEGRRKKLAQPKSFWFLPSVCTCKTRTEDDLVMAEGKIGLRYIKKKNCQWQK